LFVFVLVVVLLTNGYEASVVCRDENGKPVDWWIIMKAPRLPDNSNPTAKAGYAYAYADKNKPAITFSNSRLDNPNGALSTTLNQIYTANAAHTAWLMYNDQPRNGSASEVYGHSKGDVCFDGTSGFWLVHSVPRFPVAAGTTPYTYPEDETDNGQSFLCITLDTPVFETVAYAFLLNRPFVYDSTLPQSLMYDVPPMQQVIDKKFEIKEAQSNVSQLETIGGTPFTVFSRNAKWGSYLYSDFVEKQYNFGLAVESWMNGAEKNKMPSFCAWSQYKYSTINVRQVTLSGSVQWPETKDHSKWAINLSSKPPIYCIGDTNRQYSQAKRGGGTVCGSNPTVWASFNTMISAKDSCT